MKRRTGKKIIIIITIIIAIIIGILAYLYFATDMLKTNEQLFFKYLGKMTNTESGFVEGNIKTYFEKKENTPYTNNSQYYVNTNISGISDEMQKCIDDFNISFSGNIDNKNNKVEQDISINYSDKVKFPIKYKYVDDTFGVQMDDVSSKYLGVKNENLDEFAKKLGGDSISMPEKIDMDASSKLEFTEEEKSQIKSTYFPIMETKFKGKQFKKAQDKDGTLKYSVQVTNSEIKELIIEMLEKLKTDKLVLDKLNNAINEETDTFTEQSIQNIIDNLNEEELQQNSANITISQKDGKTTGATIETITNGTNIQILLQTYTDDNGLTYNLELNYSNVDNAEESGKIYLKAIYNGIEQLDNVKEIYQLGFSNSIDGEEIESIYTFETTCKFDDNIDIQSFGDEDIEMIDEYESEQLQSFMNAVGERITENNKARMQEIGLNENENLMMYALPFSHFSSMMIYSSASEQVNENSFEETEKQLFNQKFLSFEGEVNSAWVKALLQRVADNNKDGTRGVEVKINGATVIGSDETEYNEDVVTGSSYTVECEYDNDGFINLINVE